MAANTLNGVRANFVDSVGLAIIKQLLDDLSMDGVLNRGEADSITKDGPGRADRARKLIDTVVKKGDAASRAMITRLRERDPELYAKLGLQDQLNEPKPQQEQKKKSVYPVTKEATLSRVALLITNIKFEDPRANRHGAEKDEENMKKQLEDLGYEVVKHTNLTGKAIEDAVIDFSKHPKLKGTDSVVVVIMSHGKKGFILGVEDTDEETDEFPIDKIFTYLGSKRCPALLNKPKIIIIQACRGGKKGSVLVRDDGPSLACDDSSQPAGLEADNVKHVHKEKDFISFLSCTPDTVAYRDEVTGSYLIQYVVEVFNTFAGTDHIIELFRMVMERFERKVGKYGRQMPTIDRCSLTKHFYFSLGH